MLHARTAQRRPCPAWPAVCPVSPPLPRKALGAIKQLALPRRPPSGHQPVRVSCRALASPVVEEESQVDEKYQWTKAWFPVAVTSHLDPSKPFATRLLGKELVVWRDASGCWRCFEDRCPHRLAPLSQGRIEPSDGSLQCSYHGWRFGGDGKAVAIPQARFDGPAVENAALASSRSCAKSYPTLEELDMVWVWPDDSATAETDAASTRPALPQRVQMLSPEEVGLTTNQNFVRDMPVAYDVLLENIADQSHVPFAHHGVANKRDSPWANHFRITGDRVSPEGFTYDLEWSPDAINPPIRQTVTFHPPSLIEYFTPKEKGFTALWFYVVPLDEHFSRVFNHAVIAQPLPGIVKRLAAARPSWLDHLLLNEIFDGDLAYLSKASALFHERASDSWSKDYFLAAKADRSVVAWRKWFHGRGGGDWLPPQLPRSSTPQLSRRELLDRYSQHTRDCPSCSKALENTKKGQVLAKAAAAALFLVAAAKLGQGLDPLALAPALAGCATCLGLSSLLHAAQQKFVFTEYDHARR